MTKRVAIIGYSFKFPGTSTSQYWQSLLDERDLVTEVESGRWAQDTYHHPNKKHQGTSYTFAAGSIGDAATFDAAFFGISPREAALLDPQQRLLLEMSWEALENSGIKPSAIRGSQCGVFIGIASADYSYRLAEDLGAIDASVATGNTASIAANRISYVLDLRGPSMAIDTACSSSMVAFHQACRSILSGESSQALAGGVSLHLHPYGFIAFSKASMLSASGHCRVFDAAADGYVRSEGGGVFFLKDYEQAIADGDPILAVVANSAINTDGQKSGLTVPKAEIQTALMEQAYAQAGIDPAAIDYLEAHGTGTVVGDPVEAKSIGDALGKYRDKNTPLLIGSVKSNLGHLEAASGVAGLVKALHCIEHREVPASIGINKLNPNIDFDNWNIEVVRKRRLLKETGTLTIGVNSFGFGGANAHVILQSHEPAVPAVENSSPRTRRNLALPIVLSAKDDAALRTAARDFSRFLIEQQPNSFYDVAHNTVFRREWHEHRAVVYGSATKTVAAALLDFANDVPGQCAVVSGVAPQVAAGAVFIYSGNGSQWAGMGRQLLEKEPVFRQAVCKIDALFSRHADYSLVDELAGRNGGNRYEHTEFAQPALFAIQVGITQMLRRRGILPVAVAGHSVGEVAAAWASGALTLAAAVKVIYHRSRLQAATKGKGEMTAVALGAEDAQQWIAQLGLASSLVIAGINSPRGVAVAGNAECLARLESALTKAAIFNRRLDLDYAFHSSAMDEIELGVRQSLAALRPRKSQIPFYSTVTGEALDGRELNAAYWWRNIRNPVLFERAVNNIQDDGSNIFIEVGPHAIMRGYINDCLSLRDMQGRVIPTLARGDDDPQRVSGAVSEAIIAGARVDWPHVFPAPGQFKQLPNYPWQRERHWHPVTTQSIGLLERRKVHPLLGYRLQQHELTWENELDTLRNPMLADHVIGDAIVFPGAGFCELALAAAMAWHPGDFAEIEELEIRAPLLLSNEHTMLMRLSVDAQDGSLNVCSKEQFAEVPWTLHAVGRILREPHDVLLREERLVVPTRHPDFHGASHEMLTQAFGLGYGPAFQCIDYGWIKDGYALAALKTPQCIDADMHENHLHPALLDCTFQLIIQLLKDYSHAHSEAVFVPTNMGRIAFRAGTAAPGFARARVLRRTAHTLTAEFTVFDTDGLVIAVIKEARFRSVRLSKSAADHLRFLDYHGIPQPHANAPIGKPVIAFEIVRSAVAEVARRSALNGSHRRYSEEVDPLLDSLCSRFASQALQRLSSGGEILRTAQVLAYRTVSPEIEPFLDYLLMMAEDDQSVAKTDKGWRFLTDEAEQASAQDIWNSLVADCPDYFQIVHSVGRVGMNLGALLGGHLSLQEMYPQESSLTMLTRQVLGADGKREVGQVLRNLIEQGINQLPEGRRLGIVEISEGPPLFASDICGCMDFVCCDYEFASTSASTLEDTERLKEQYFGLDTQLIGDSSAEPGSVSTCQIAIVTLDFDSPDKALDALEYARYRITPQGSIMVICHHPSRWVDFVRGAQRQHWSRSEDGAWSSNQRTALFWLQHLQKLGFSNTTACEFSPDTLSGPYFLLAQQAATPALTVASDKSMPRSWILMADEHGYSAQLSDQLTNKLQARGDLVVQACPGDTAHIASLLRETTESYGELDGLVHLSGLCPAAAATEAQQVFDQQLARCTTAASIVQACETTQTNTTCWLITTGAVANLLPQRGAEKRAQSSVIAENAALWGFGRTLINEASNFTVRMIDLEDLHSIETIAVALDREFSKADDEQEVILTRHGARYVPRLRIEPRPAPHAPQEAAKAPTIHLGFQVPGQLRNLRWEALPHSAPASGEIEVNVHTTGLNFRDVMYALGLLSDEAVENGFAGPSLGLEFSGVVHSVGSEITGFAIGDRVVGFGPSSFGNKVITHTSAVSHIPSRITSEAAATIPSTFFSAYYALHFLARLQPGEKVLIHGAAGGVGIAAIQLAKWLGAEIYATAGSDEKRDFLRLLGIEHIYDSRTLAFADEILAHTDGKGVDVVLNSLAGEAINGNFRVLKPFGRFLELGKRDFYENTKIGLRPFRNNISYFGIDADQLMHTRPELTRSLFAEVMALFKDGTLHPLPYRVFEADDIVDAFRYMQQARQIGKIVINYDNGINHVQMPVPTIQKPLQFDADVTFLVTGGLRGFGLRTAQWLVSKGARHLILISRSGPITDEATDAISALLAQGVKVHARACDITDKHAIASLLAEAAAQLPPIKGIVHAATVINDGLIRNTDAKQIRSALAPKVLGARHLHDMTLGMALDYFILFSSATTLFGNPGQANYVAANACLESLAEHRRACDLAATCVRWGAIDDVGFLARNEKIKDALQSRMGGAALNSEIALSALESMLLAGRSNLGVMELDWSALSRFLPSAATPKFSELARHHSDDGNEDDSGDIQRLLQDLSATDLLNAITQMLKDEVGEILRVAPDKIDPTRSIYEIGLDSLMGVELVVALESRFGIRLPVMALSQSPTIAKLAERLIEQLQASNEDDTGAEDSGIVAETIELAAQHDNEASRESLVALATDIHSEDPASRARIIS